MRFWSGLGFQTVHVNLWRAAAERHPERDDEAPRENENVQQFNSSLFSMWLQETSSLEL
jgi:hypothetical protein